MTWLFSLLWVLAGKILWHRNDAIIISDITGVFNSLLLFSVVGMKKAVAFWATAFLFCDEFFV